VKAVDRAGLVEIHRRWFAEEAARLGFWMLLLVSASAVLTLTNALILTAFVSGGPAAVKPGETLADRLALAAGGVILMHAWPLAAALLARLTLWPQLLRPAALAVLALSTRSVPLLVGLLAGGMAGWPWMARVFRLFLLLDFVNLALLTWGWFVYRRAAAAHRSLAPAGEDNPTPARRTAGRLAAGASVAYAVVLAVCMVTGVMAVGGQASVIVAIMPLKDAWDERAARKDFNEGVAALPGQPARAEAAFRRALPQWQRLADNRPARPDYRHNQALTHQNLGLSLKQLGQARAAEEQFDLALSAFDRLEAHAPHYNLHKPNRAKAEEAVAQIRLTRRVSEDGESFREGQRLVAAGRHREAAAVYRESLERYERRASEFPNPLVYRLQLAVQQNRLAWLLVTSPDPEVRDAARAVALAKMAVGHDPDQGDHWATLGAAHYRSGNWEECRAALERSMQTPRGRSRSGWFFLAMACHRLGRPDEARQWLDRAVRWSEQFPRPAAGEKSLATQQRDLDRREADLLRREAEELILGKGAARESK
jgi:tetratricopeptide (TPR) repeat protein